MAPFVLVFTAQIMDGCSAFYPVILCEPKSVLLTSTNYLKVKARNSFMLIQTVCCDAFFFFCGVVFWACKGLWLKSTSRHFVLSISKIN